MNEKIGFHGASIVACETKGETLELVLEDVQTDNVVTDALVHLRGIRQILRDGVTINRFEMEGDDAEILKLRIDVSPIFLLVEWQRYKPRQRRTVTYEIFCDIAEPELRTKSPTTSSA